MDEQTSGKAKDEHAKDEQATVEEASSLTSPLIYETIRQEGEEELRRPIGSLWWSGIAAGLGLSASICAEGFLHHRLPDAEWAPMVQSFGYCLGFLIVILSRFQLFTENTITVILPLLAEPGWRALAKVGRLWSVVLVANLVGTGAAAAVVYYFPVMAPEQLAALFEVAREVERLSYLTAAARAVPAGFLIAALVWIMPSAQGGTRFWAVVAVTYLIAIGDGTHIIASSTEVFLLLLAGEIGLGATFLGVLLPTLVGNVVGGTGLFTLIAYGQVRKEL